MIGCRLLPAWTPRFRGWRLTWLLAWTLTAACADDPRSEVGSADPGPESTPAAPREASSTYSLEDLDVYGVEPELRIDGYAANLVSVAFLSVSADGTMAFSQRQDGGVAFFDRGGRALGVIGQHGDGPGDFRTPGRKGWLGDTLWVADFELGRVSFISPELEVARTVPVRSAVPSPADRARFPTAINLAVEAVYPGDTLLVAGQWSAGSPLTARFDDPPLLRISDDGVIQRWVLDRPRSDAVRIGSETGGLMTVAVPFTHRPLLAISGDGSRIAALTTSSSGPEGGTLSLRVVDARGSEIFHAAYPFRGERIPADAADGAIEAIASRWPPSYARSSRGAEMQHVLRTEARSRIPPIYPPVQSLVLDGDGRIWIGFRRTEEGNPWVVLDSRGEPLRRLVLPANVRLEVADASHIWAVETDELGVQSIIRYRLIEGELR